MTKVCRPLTVVWLVLFCLIHLTAYPQQKQRLKKYYNRHQSYGNLSSSDSTIFYYSGYRGSTFNINRWNRGFSHFNFPGYFTYSSQACMPEVYYDYILETLYDSVKKFYPSSSGLLYDSSCFYVSYMADTMPVSCFEPIPGRRLEVRIPLSYNEQGKVTSIYQILVNDSTGSEDTFRSARYMYKPDGTLSEIIVTDKGSFGLEIKNYYNTVGEKQVWTDRYTYHNVSTPWTLHEHFIYDKDTIVRIDYRESFGGNWIYSGYDTIGYDDKNIAILARYGRENEPYIVYETYYNSAGDPVSRIASNYDGSGKRVDSNITHYFINQYHNPDSIITTHTLNANDKLTSIFVYELYGEDAPPIRKPFIYPVPARDIIHIRWHKDFSNTALKLKLYNIVGQEMRSYSIDNPKLTDDFNINGLVAGTYLLRINTAATNEYVYSGKIIVL